MRLRYHRAARVFRVDLTDAPTERTDHVDTNLVLRCARDGEVLGVDVFGVDEPTGIEVVEPGLPR